MSFESFNPELHSQLEYGTRPIPLFIVVPNLREMIGDSFPSRIKPVGYTKAIKQLKTLPENSCCVLSFILSPDIKRLDRGPVVILQRDIEATIVSHNIGSSGHQIYAAIIKPIGSSDASMVDLATRWLREIKSEGYKIDKNEIDAAIRVKAAHLPKEQRESIRNKMLRMRYGVECLPMNEEVDLLAREELRGLEWEYFGSVKESDIKTASGKWDPSLTKQIRNRMLSLKYDIDCSRESENDADEDELVIAEEMLQDLEDDIFISSATIRDINSYIKATGGTERMRELMIRIKYGIQSYPEDEEVNRVAKKLYRELEREVFGNPSDEDIRHIALEVEPIIRDQVESKMLAIKYKID